MTRKRYASAGPAVDEPGQDAFLDIVANIVGILIILVVVVGVRASHVPVSDLSTAAIAESHQDAIESKQSHAYAIFSDVARLYEQSESVAREAVLHQQSRDHLNTMVAAAEVELAARRAALDDKTRDEFDLHRSLEASRAELDRLSRERLAIEREAAETVQIESLPTPLGKKVAGQEGHFQLRKGNIAAIPLHKLMRRAQSEERRKVLTRHYQLTSTDTVGPIDGFRMSYRMIPFGVSVGSPTGAGYGATHGWVRQFYVLPVSDHVGETLKQALASGSQFRQELKSLNPRDSTITLWTYPDSFAEFRSCKKELHVLGYQVACRALPDDGRIGFSSQGTRSVAQ